MHSIFVNWFDQNNPIPDDVRGFLVGSAEDDNAMSIDSEFIVSLEEEPPIRVSPPPC